MIRGVQRHDPYVLPPDLPEPEDDGAADHLPGAPHPVARARLVAGPGRPRRALRGARRALRLSAHREARVESLPGWDEFPGARGCTPQSCAFRDHAQELAGLGALVAGLSAQTLDDQIEFAERTHMPYPVLADPELRAAQALGLPTFSIAGHRLYRRLALVARRGRIEKVFYPVFPPDRNAGDVVAYLRATVA